eukprot:TRINITY_DN108_c0_g1_i1.p1 TRINITY_DN108_c0_g1~~TRINITY_DN108_c0_g1_i1.p1  ORF type:complete len:376 (+),score=17.36 TRINITY_DN108_c0_g1_i1:153-1130(+)
MYYRMSIEEHFIRGVCQKLRLQEEFPHKLQLTRNLLNSCQCNKVPVPCMKPFEFYNVNTSDYKLAFVLSYDLLRVQNYTEALPLELSKDIRFLHPKADIIIIVPNDTTIQQETWDVAKGAGIQITKRPHINLSESLRQTQYYEKRGSRDFLILHAFSFFDYDTVIFFDSAVRVKRPLTPLINCMSSFDFITTNGIQQVVDLGMFAVKPNPKLWEALLEYLATSVYSKETGWNYSYQNKPQYRGDEAVPGALYAFFYLYDKHAIKIFNESGIQPPLAAQVDRCMYNFSLRRERMCYRIVPIVVRQDHNLIDNVEWMKTKIQDTELN